MSKMEHPNKCFDDFTAEAKAPRCQKEGHSGNRLNYVCQEDKCATCQARGSKMYCIECLRVEGHNFNIKHFKKYSSSNCSL